MAGIPEESKCQYNFLGSSGLRVSSICLGALTFGKSPLSFWGELDETTSHKLLDRFVEWGGNFIDTANAYGYGNSEKIVGSWLARQERDRFVVATKVRCAMDPTNPNAEGLSRRHILQSVDQSLERLQTDYIDLLQPHTWDDATPLEETLMAMNDLVRSGKVRYLGASNLTGWQMQKYVEVTKRMGLNPLISLQQQYSLLSRDSELEAFQVCKLNGVGVLPWGPLKSGFLAGKLKRGQVPVEGRLHSVLKDPNSVSDVSPHYSHFTDKHWATLDAVEAIAKKRGKSVAQVSLRWLLQKSVVSSVIIGATKVHQVDDNMGAANGWELTEDEMKTLDDANPPSLTAAYPYGLNRTINVGRQNPWNPSGHVQPAELIHLCV